MMNATTLYENITAILNEYKAAHNISDALLNELMFNPTSWKKSGIPDVRIICGLLEIQKACREDAIKKNGKGNKLTICKSILKSTPSHCECFRGAWIDNEGRFCMVDGYRAIRLNEKIESIPMIADDVKKFDLQRIYDGAKDFCNEAELPTIAELKLHIAEQKVNNVKIPTYDFGEGKPLVNAKWLLDMLQAFPDATKAKYKDDKNLIVIESVDGDGIILPIRKNK